MASELLSVGSPILGRLSDHGVRRRDQADYLATRRKVSFESLGEMGATPGIQSPL